MKNIKKTVSGQSGFTLVEVLIAMLILTVGLLTIAGWLSQMMLVLTDTTVHLAAKEVARGIIADFSAQKLLESRESFCNKISSYTRDEFSICGNGESPSGALCTDRSKPFTVTIDNNSDDTVARLDITVTYSVKSGGTRTYQDFYYCN